MQPAVPPTWDVPSQWRTAAEAVREHLCALRGGALFLSPDDSVLLVLWLERQVPVHDILRALERAADARSKNRGRFPLSLTRAKRHLGKPTRGVFSRSAPAPATAPTAPPFGAVARALRGVPHQTPALVELQRALLGIETEGEAAMVEALAHVRAYLQQAWEELSDADRSSLREQAKASLGDLAEFLDEATLDALVEEESRTLFRQRVPCVSAASLWELVQNDGR